MRRAFPCVQGSGLECFCARCKSTKSSASESNVQARVRLEAARKGVRLYRNNSGAWRDKTGRVIRYGLGNDSKDTNEVLKSPDLVGWRKILITPDMVGSYVAKATLRECKPEGWHYAGTDEEVAQKRFLDMCTADGGDAKFATDDNSL